VVEVAVEEAAIEEAVVEALGPQPANAKRERDRIKGNRRCFIEVSPY
jgi:hypothetical protein